MFGRRKDQAEMNVLTAKVCTALTDNLEKLVARVEEIEDRLYDTASQEDLDAEVGELSTSIDDLRDDLLDRLSETDGRVDDVDAALLDEAGTRAEEDTSLREGVNELLAFSQGIIDGRKDA